MGISGTQTALMYALSGVARAGATRSGYTSPKVFVSINGVQYATGRPSLTTTIDDDSLSTTEVLNETPNTCTFSTRGFEPTEGQEVVVTLGSKNNLDRQYAGTILNRTHGYVGSPAAYNNRVNVIDYTWMLTRRRITKLYTSTSATAIALDLATYVTGFTTHGVQTGLATVDSFSLTDVDILTAFTRLAARIGGYTDVDYRKDIKLFVGADATVTNPTSLTSTHRSLDEFKYTRDLSQVITRQAAEGGGGNAYFDTAAGATSLALDSIGWYGAAGGVARSGNNVLTYTGVGGGFVAPIIDQRIQTAPSTINWERVVWADSLGLFVAVAGNATASTVMTSPDGTTWTARTAATSDVWQGLAWSSDLTLLVAVSNGGTIMSSPDGITWTSRTSPEANGWTGVCWSTALSLFVMVSNSGTHRVQTSPDGVTWTSRTAASASVWQDVVWAASLSLFVACGTGTALMTSPDGTTWTSQTIPAGQYLGLAWSPTLSLLVAVGGFSTPIGYIATSPDGVTWTARTPPNNNNWKRVIWISELGVFVACSSDGAGTTGRRIMSSTNGITWTDYTTATAGLWFSLAWSPTLSLIVVVGVTGGSAIMTSTVKQYGTLIGIPASGDGSIKYPIIKGQPVNLRVVVNDLTAQATLAALIGGTDDGIVEGPTIVDNRVTLAEATALATAKLNARKDVLVTITFKTRDVNTHAGRTITVSLGSPTSVTGTFQIQQVTISAFLPALMPTYTVTASSNRFSLEDLLRLARQGLAATT